MKETRSLVNGLLACGVAVAMVSTLTAQPAKEMAATVTGLKGTARFMELGGQWQPVKVGMSLKLGTLVQTAVEEGSYVDLALGGTGGAAALAGAAQRSAVAGLQTYKVKTEQNVVRIYENSSFGIDKMVVTETGDGVITDTELDLKKGHIIGSVKKMIAGSRYEVKYPNGVAGIRGSIYDMYLVDTVVNGQAKTKCILKMLDGSAVLSYYDANGKLVTQVVPSANAFDTISSQLSPIPTMDISAGTQTIGSISGGAGGPTTTVLVVDRSVSPVPLNNVTTTSGTP